MCLILLKLRSRLVSAVRWSRFLMCAIRLSYRSSSVSVGGRSSIFEMVFWRRQSRVRAVKRERRRGGIEETRACTQSISGVVGG